MKIKLKQIDHTLFEGISPTGHTTRTHSPIRDGEEKKALSPMENLLVAAAGCTSIDVVMILDKMKQHPGNIKIDIEGDREEINDAKPFRALRIHYTFFGEVDQIKATRAVKLSVEKYCSVLESLHSDTSISWSCSFEE